MNHWNGIYRPIRYDSAKNSGTKKLNNKMAKYTIFLLRLSKKKLAKMPPIAKKKINPKLIRKALKLADGIWYAYVLMPKNT